jgi:hypothetical protein
VLGRRPKRGVAYCRAMAGPGRPNDTSRPGHAAGVVRWLACALVLHALLVVGASRFTSAPRSSLSAPSVESDVDFSFDIVEPEPPEPIPFTTPPDAASAERAVEQSVRAEGRAPSTSASPERGAQSEAPQFGLRTISNGTGAWPENIPHHLGRITGSRHGGVAVWGELSESSLRRTVTDHSASIRRCYDEGLNSAPTLAGRAIMRLVIQRDGYVQRVNTLGSDLASRTVLACLESVFQSIRFPRASSDTVIVTYPLPLSPAQAPDWGMVP